MLNALRQLFDPGDWLAIRPQLDPAASELVIDYRPDAGLARLQLMVGGVVTVVAFAVFSFFDDTFVRLISAGFGAFGLLNIGLSVLQTGYRKRLNIGPTTVRCSTASILGGEQWEVSLRSYIGVRARERQLAERGVGNIDTTKTYHVVELAHRDPSKTVPLYVSEKDTPPRAQQEAFAARFGLSALARDGQGEQARTVFHEALVERPVVPPPPGRKPERVQITEDGLTTEITLGKDRSRGYAFFFAMLALGWTAGGLITLSDPQFGLAIASIATFFICLAALLSYVLARFTHRVEPVSICLDDSHIWVSDTATKLARNRVEQIRVEPYTSLASDRSFHHCLLVEMDDARLRYIGTQFDRERLEWVRDYLTRRIATGV